MVSRYFLIAGLLVFTTSADSDWGFFAHQKINRLAVFTLPPAMFGFYKHHMGYIEENAINPDKRRYVNPREAPRHYIDLDIYGDSALAVLPKYWDEAVAKFSEDTLQAYGILPWHVNLVRHRLTKAFMVGDITAILGLSADLGHYIGDAHVPLHTTQNYNGQLTGQHGIHGFWESRLPELFAGDYDFFVGRARYLDDPQGAIWQAIAGAHGAVDSVLRIEKALSASFGPDKKYSFEQRGTQTAKVYARSYALAYQQQLNGMVERQMRAAIGLVGDFWYTCWVDAGQPDLDTLASAKIPEEEIAKKRAALGLWLQKKYEGRGHDH